MAALYTGNRHIDCSLVPGPLIKAVRKQELRTFKQLKALNAFAGQPQEGQAIPSPPTDTQKATYVNTDEISTGQSKDSYEKVMAFRE